MSNKRMFTDEELKEMGTPTLDLIKRAVDAGDKEKAKALAERLQSEIGHLHDGYMVWVSGLLSYIYRNYGVDAVEEAEREAHGIEGRSVFKQSGKTDFKSMAYGLASGLRGHMQPIVIKEDDEKITFTMKPCGSGERLIQMGLYEPEYGLAKIKERHPATWGMKDFPIYCCHCPIMEMLTIEATGKMGAAHIVSEPMKFGECHFAIYKDANDIPEEYYARIGKIKPQ